MNLRSGSPLGYTRKCIKCDRRLVDGLDSPRCSDCISKFHSEQHSAQDKNESGLFATNTRDSNIQGTYVGIAPSDSLQHAMNTPLSSPRISPDCSPLSADSREICEGYGIPLNYCTVERQEKAADALPTTVR